ncbi:N-acetyl sugar amidotransferase [Acetobacterium paludosum]|uniref:N-acetyl sugar amidotransferase n=2 Tax=Acetobacterium paludosum TaxID=52693 RepID=A0A923HYA5_9FIRM|nr:N-acetyl sugar amidotransferase [Acetobacterium paludosum]
MDIAKKRTDVDFSKFEQVNDDLDVKYGLPREIKFCKKCVISNQRPNSCVEYDHTNESKKETIHFDDEGVCDACRSSEKKKKIDWDLREKELIELCDKHRSKDGSYDCLIPGSGGKDSFYQAHILKYKYGMHPLTVTWAPHIYTPWGWKNFQAWINAGFDNILYTPDGKIHRLLTRLAIENLFHPFQPFIFGQKALAPKVAALYNISLVFYGENEAEYGNPLADNQSAKRDYKYFTSEDKRKIYLSGVPMDDLKRNYGIDDGELKFYIPADPEILEEKKIEVHYLGYYLSWHPQGAYYYAVENGGFEAAPERTPGTYSKYNSIDDKIDDFHYYTTYIKFGIGRATYDAAQEIRNDEITRDEGVALVKKFDGEFPERFADEIFKYLSITEKEYSIASQMFEEPKMNKDYFMNITDRFRSPHLWKNENGIWKLRKTVFSQE